MGKRIVLFNDLPGYGKVALAAMVPLFSRMGHFPYQVPTAVVSNTLDFGKFRIQICPCRFFHFHTGSYILLSRFQVVIVIQCHSPVLFKKRTLLG